MKTKKIKATKEQKDLVDRLLYNRNPEMGEMLARIASPAIIIELHARKLMGIAHYYEGEYSPLNDMSLDVFVALVCFPELVDIRSPEQQLDDLYSTWDEAWDEDAIYSYETLFNAHKSAVKTAAEILGYVHSADGFKPKGGDSIE